MWKLPIRKQLRTTRRISSAILLILFSGAFLACQSPTAAGSTPTKPPATSPVPAVGQPTLNAGVPSSSGTVWTGSIHSQTTRQYVDNTTAALLNTCTTTWVVELTFLVDALGEISGYGDARLQGSEVACTPKPQSGNTTHQALKIQGLKDADKIYLQLSVDGYEPPGSAELAGYGLLFDSAFCPVTARALEIPATNKGSAETTLSDSLVMGCSGSLKDQLNAESTIKLNLAFDCASVPENEKTSEAAGLCQ